MNKVFFGDCRDTMRRLIAGGVKVQCCVTSPPYFALRDYGVAGQIGLEETPLQYIDVLVDVFRLVRELLADDGVLWLNLGDSYASGGGTGKQGKRGQRFGRRHTQEPLGNAHHWPEIGIKPKDLMGIPWRVALALQADGWYLRQDVVWHKPNTMPESVSDRCTKAHEYLFLMSKRGRYYWDAEAMKEPVTGNAHSRGDGIHPKSAEPGSGIKANTSFSSAVSGLVGFRNRRSVWTVQTQPYGGAHFATFPAALIEPCILAGSRPGDTVFDPFFGSGTVGEVAGKFGRNWIGCELNEDYAEMQKERTAQRGMPL